MRSPADDAGDTFVRHEPCPECGSRNNLARYADGHAHCFGCGHRERGDGEAVPDTPRKEKRMDLLKGEVGPIAPRGLTQETCEKFNYRLGEFRGRRCHIANYYGEDGRVVAQKIRYKEDGKKSFTWVGDPKAALLYGQRHKRNGGRRVYITEGEIDALSVAQALRHDWPVVSVPNGAQGARKDLAKHIAWLEQFSEIALCFDNDEPGRKAVADCATLFSPGKVRIVEFPEGIKDANDMVKANRTAELVSALWEAKTFRPDGIRSVSDLRAKAKERPRFGRPWPWVTMTARTYGIRPEIYSWGAGVGSGKTTTMKQLMLTTMRPDLLPDHSSLVDGYGNPITIPGPRKVGTFLFEEPPEKTLRSLAGMAMGLRLNKPDAVYDDADLDAEFDKLDGLFFPFDTFGAKDWSVVKAQVLYLIQAEGVRDIWIDPLTALVAQAEDERRELDAVMADISGIVTTHGCTIHLVSHLTTPKGTPHEEGGRVHEKDFTGSRAIARWSHNMVGLERDKQSDLPTCVRGLKDREFGEATGPLIALHFDETTGCMVEVDLSELEAEPSNPFKDETNDDL